MANENLENDIWVRKKWEGENVIPDGIRGQPLMAPVPSLFSADHHSPSSHQANNTNTIHRICRRACDLTAKFERIGSNSGILIMFCYFICNV